MERTRLCIVTDAWTHQVNGVVTTLTNLVEQATNDGWDVLVLHPGLFKNYSAPGYPEIKLSIPLGLKKMIRDFAPHHLHIATEGPLGIAARISFRKRTFTTAYHTKWPEFLNDIFYIPIKLTKKFLRWFHHNGKVMVPTESIRQELIKDNIGKEVVLFSRGVDLSNLKPYIKHGTNKKINLLCVSRLSKEKNLDVFCGLDPQKYQLVMVGDGPYRDELIKKYPHVYFTGVLKGTDLANEYVKADCFVFPSVKDTFGLVMIESQCLGTPVAAFPVPGPIDVVNQYTGVLNTDINIAIEQALKVDRVLCAKTAQELYNWKFAWKQFKDHLIEHEDDNDPIFF